MLCFLQTQCLLSSCLTALLLLAVAGFSVWCFQASLTHPLIPKHSASVHTPHFRVFQKIGDFQWGSQVIIPVVPDQAWFFSFLSSLVAHVARVFALLVFDLRPSVNSSWIIGLASTNFSTSFPKAVHKSPIRPAAQATTPS